jgi:outer membrane protein
LEARSATAQAKYDLQAILGAEQIARCDLATAMGEPADTTIRVQSFREGPAPDAFEDTVEQVIDRAIEQRPDLQAEVAGVREARAQRKEANAALYPTLGVSFSPTAESLSLLQQNLPWGIHRIRPAEQH